MSEEGRVRFASNEPRAEGQPPRAIRIECRYGAIGLQTLNDLVLMVVNASDQSPMGDPEAREVHLTRDQLYQLIDWLREADEAQTERELRQLRAEGF